MLLLGVGRVRRDEAFFSYEKYDSKLIGSFLWLK